MQTPAQFLTNSAGRHRMPLLVRSALSLIGSVSSLVYPWLAGSVASNLLGSGGGNLALSTAFAGMLLLAVFQAALATTDQWVWARVYAQARFDLRTRLYDHLQRLELEQHHARTRGEAMTLIERDAESIAAFVTGTLVSVVPALVTLAGSAALMIWLQPSYGLMALLVVPAYVAGLRLARRRLRRLSGRLARAWARANQVADEQLALLPVIKAFGREADMSERFRARDEETRELGRGLFFASGALSPISKLVAAVGVLMVLWSMSGLVLAHELPASEFLVFFMYAFLFTGPLGTLAGVYGAVNSNWGSAGRLVEVLSEPIESDEGAAVERFELGVFLQQIEFAYPGRPAVLRDLSLELPYGEVTVILGPNGAGKSTLLKLLLGYITPASGRVRVDAQNADEIARSSLRRLFALVPQEMMLLAGSIHDNIALGLARATREDVVAAAKLAHAHQFIEALPDGYDTVIGEAGVFLSGGQRQRLALARALIKRAPVLLLDEATAMFDKETEREFFRACRDAFAGRTVIVVGHHLGDLSFAHRVVEMQDGRVVSVQRLQESES